MDAARTLRQVFVTFRAAVAALITSISKFSMQASWRHRGRLPDAIEIEGSGEENRIRKDRDMPTQQRTRSLSQLSPTSRAV